MRAGFTMLALVHNTSTVHSQLTSTVHSQLCFTGLSDFLANKQHSF